MKIKRNCELVIIGGGPAGLSAGIYAIRAALDALLLERGAPGGQASTTEYIENYPGFIDGIGGPELAANMEAQARRLGLDIDYVNVNELSKQGDRFIVETDNESIAAKTVILATGAQPRTLGVKGEKEFVGRGVSYCATCDGAFFRDKKVAVIGGGDAAVEEAIYLTKLVEKVYLIHRRGELRAAKLAQQRAFKNSKIEFIWHSVLEQVYGNSVVEAINIKDVRTGETRSVAVDGIFVYVGIVPNSKLVEKFVSLDDSGFVITDENMQTSHPGLFAAGDVRKKPLRQVVTAVADGAIAVSSVTRYLQEHK